MVMNSLPETGVIVDAVATEFMLKTPCFGGFPKVSACYVRLCVP